MLFKNGKHAGQRYCGDNEMSYTILNGKSFPPTCGQLDDYCNLVTKSRTEHIFRNSIEKVESCNDAELRGKALDFLRILKSFVDNWVEENGICVGDIPKLLPDISDENCYFEWIFRHTRIGFNISLKETDNGYFMISDKEYGGIDFSQPFKEYNFMRNVILFVEASIHARRTVRRHPTLNNTSSHLPSI